VEHKIKLDCLEPFFKVGLPNKTQFWGCLPGLSTLAVRHILWSIHLLA